MKKAYLLSMILISLLFTNCKKDNDKDDEASEAKKVVPTVIKNYDANGTLESTETYTYDGRLITKVLTVSGADTTVSDYYYNDTTKGLLDSIVSVKNGVFDGVSKYTNSNDLISRIETFDANRNLQIRQDFVHYTGDKPDQLRMLIHASQYGDINLVGTITYSSDNAETMSLTGTISGLTFNQTITNTYDTNNPPFLNVTSLFEPKINVNNVLTVTTDTSSTAGNQHQVDTMVYTCNADKYPTRVDTSEDGQNQGYVEYTYEKK